MSNADQWAGLLEPGEEILWQGRPDPGFALKLSNILLAIFGFFFASFALFWMAMAYQSGGGFWMFGLLHFTVGLGFALSSVFWPTFRRRRSWYTLTNRRAFIAANLPLRGKILQSYPITAKSTLELIDGALATVNFAEKTKSGKNGSYTVPVGFERITDGREVYRLLRQIQAGAPDKGTP
jgi:hypothetical protein